MDKFFFRREPIARGLFAALVTVTLLATIGCAGLTSAIHNGLTPRNAYIAEAGVKVALAGAQTFAASGHMSASLAAKGVTYAGDARTALTALRSAYDSGDLVTAALQLVALAQPIAKVQGLSSDSVGPPSTATDIAAAIGLFTSLSATYGEAQVVLKGDPANIPAALAAMRGEVDAQFVTTQAALHAAGGG